MLILAIVCNKDYLHVVITIKVANFSDQSFFSRLIALFLLPKNGNLSACSNNVST